MTSALKRCALVIAIVGLTVLSSIASRASVPIVDVDPSTRFGSEDHFNAMIGWTFTPKTTLTVSQIGWYDSGQDGLSRPIQVGLWSDFFNDFSPNDTVVQLFSGTIPAGTSANLNGVWRVINLPKPIVLSPGSSYELGGLDSSTSTDDIAYYLASNYPGSPFTPDQPNLIVEYFFYDVPLNSFHVTMSPYFYIGYGLEVGPMLFTTPEPTTLGICGIGMLLLYSRRHRQRSS